MKNILTILLISLLAFSFNACDEEDSLLGTPTDEDMQPVVDNINAEKGVMTAASYMSPYGLDEELSTKGMLEDKPSYFYDTATKTLTVDFTNVSGMGGEIVVAYNSDPLADNLLSIGATASMNGFVQDGVTYNGAVIFSMSVGLTVQMTVRTSDGEVISINDGGGSYTWSGSRTITWLEGFETYTDDMDDVYQLMGNSSGISSTGTNYESTIITPLVLAAQCDYVMYGSQEIKNKVGENNESSLTMTYNVDANGDELQSSVCNSYFKMHYVSGLMDLTMVLNMDEM